MINGSTMFRKLCALGYLERWGAMTIPSAYQPTETTCVLDYPACMQWLTWLTNSSSSGTDDKETRKPASDTITDPLRESLRQETSRTSESEDISANPLTARLGQAMDETRSDEDDSGWLNFITTAADNLQFSGMIERYLEAREVKDAVEAGSRLDELGIDEEDYRLRNIAEMTDVANEVEGKVDHPAAHSLQAANFWFYTFFGNNGGSFEGMDMERYREIAAMPGEEAADVLPEFEAETFRRSQDPETIEFGNSLPEENRKELFMLHNSLFSPKKEDD